MKNKLRSTCVLFLALFLVIACSKNESSAGSSEVAQAGSSEDVYFEYTIDGQSVKLAPEDLLSTYQKFGDNVEFKIFSGKEDGPRLLLIITQDMSKPSSTPSGSEEPGSPLRQGSVSLQDYPTKGLTSNSYDGFANPKPTITQDAILVTSSEKVGEEGRMITGTFNVTVLGGENADNDPSIKDRKVTGKFRVKHLFSGEKF